MHISAIANQYCAHVRNTLKMSVIQIGVDTEYNVYIVYYVVKKFWGTGFEFEISGVFLYFCTSAVFLSFD